MEMHPVSEASARAWIEEAGGTVHRVFDWHEMVCVRLLGRVFGVSVTGSLIMTRKSNDLVPVETRL
jgi:hypothetical protein